jgi:polysaccharide biosynthesis transport protein
MRVNPDDRAAPFDFRFVAALIQRRAALLAVTLLAGLSVAGLYVHNATPAYISSAKLLIEAPHDPQNWASAGGAVDSAQVESQVEVLRALVIAEAVVRDLNLAADPEFAAAPGGGSLLTSWLGFSGAPDSNPEAAASAADEAVRTAVASFGERIAVRRLGQSDVIEVDFSSSSPVKAARIVKATVDAYLQGKWREDAAPSGFHRFNESVVRQSLALTNARLISPATPPLGKSSPKTALVLAFAAALSLFAGLSAALWLEAGEASRLRKAEADSELDEEPAPALADALAYSLKDARR